MIISNMKRDSIFRRFLKFPDAFRWRQVHAILRCVGVRCDHVTQKPNGLPARWCPSSSAKLVHRTPITINNYGLW